MKRFPLVFALVCIVLGSSIWTGCKRDEDMDPVINPINERGRLLSAERIVSYDSTGIDSIIQSVNPFLNLFFAKTYDVEFWKIGYVTIDQFGNTTSASGGAVLPRARSGSVPAASVVGYCHGTVLHKDGAPSRGGGETTIGLLLATDGYVVAMPDYLGLGDGVEFHPYSHSKTEATATIDMIRATQELATNQEKELDGKLFLTGYSQGGHAAMATQREIEEYHTTEFNLLGSAPMSGAYDISGVQEQYLLAFDPYPTPGYLPFILWGYKSVYDYLPEPATILKPPYDTIIPPMMDQTFSIGQLNDVADPVPRRMIMDSVMDAYENDPNHPLKVALRDNDLYLGWVPQSNLRMYYCEGDDQVAYENSIVAYNSFTMAGAPNVSVWRIDTDSDVLDHNDCAPGCLLAGKLWFDSLRNAN